ncbi:MAG TPA: zinc-binding dehydrogenase [Nitrososphaerales archaeon]
MEDVGEEVTWLSKGDLVVPTVRRPCLELCENCSKGETDRCLSGRYSSHGIHGLHGFCSEFSVSDARFLVKVPQELADLGVLLEPLSVVEKAINESIAIQKTRRVKITRGLVIGAGPLGLLATSLLTLMGIRTTTVAKREESSLKAIIAKELGAEYVNVRERRLGDLGPFDFIIEASGSLAPVGEALDTLAPTAIMCVLGIFEVPQAHSGLGRRFRDIVRYNKVLLGSVSANKTHFELGMQHLHEIESRRPGVLGKMITSTVQMEDFSKFFFQPDQEEIKSVIQIG